VGPDRRFQKHDTAEGGKAGFELKEKLGQSEAIADVQLQG